MPKPIRFRTLRICHSAERTPTDAQRKRKMLDFADMLHRKYHLATNNQRASRPIMAAYSETVEAVVLALRRKAVCL